MSNAKAIAVKILNKEFQVTCPAGAEEELLSASHHLDLKMREIRNSGRVIGIERIAVMAALNITHELLVYRSQKEAYVRSVTEQIEQLQSKLDEALMDNTTETNE